MNREMTIQEIQEALQEAFNSVSCVGDSKTFREMLEDPSFVVDDDDMGYLVYEFEAILLSVKEYVSRRGNNDS
jgi:hypothetical protein